MAPSTPFVRLLSPVSYWSSHSSRARNSPGHPTPRESFKLASMRLSLPSLLAKKKRTSASSSPRHVERLKTEDVEDPSPKLLQPLTIQAATRFIELVDIPMCLIDIYGNILASNKCFKQDISLPTLPHPNILELTTSEFTDALYTQIAALKQKQMSRCSIDSSLVRVLREQGEGYFVDCTWELSKEDESSQFILVTIKLIGNREESTPSFGSKVFERPKPPLLPQPSSSRRMLRNAASAWDRFREKTETKTAQFIKYKQEQLKAQALAENLEQKRTFVRHISHEMRTPLNVVLSGLELLNTFIPQMTSDMIEILYDIKSSCHIAIDTLNDILTFEKLEGNLLALDKSNENVNQLIAKTVRMFLIPARNSGVELTLDCDSLPSETLAHIDRTKMAQVLRNLISNALKFTPSGGTVRVVVFKTSSGFVRVEVYDTGVGIDKASRGRLFHEVVQFDANKLQNGGGSGLGLYLSRKVIEMHDGVIGVDLHYEGPGSMFFLEFPCISEQLIAKNLSDGDLELSLSSF